MTTNEEYGLKFLAAAEEARDLLSILPQCLFGFQEALTLDVVFGGFN